MSAKPTHDDAKAPTRTAVAAVALLAVSSVGWAPAPATAHRSGTGVTNGTTSWDPHPHVDHNGDIAFMRADPAGHIQVWVAHSDLTGQRQLTNDSTSNSGYPTWAPGGKRLAFDSDRSDPDPTDAKEISDVFTMDPKGAHVVRITRGNGFSADPSWSPDGSLLAFETDLGQNPTKQGIYVARPDGSHLQRVTTLPPGAEFDLAPRFSPDGKQIAFTRYVLTGDVETSTLFVVNVDGSHERRLTRTADLYPGDADWSNDGRTLVFEADGPSPGSRGEIYTIRADGTHLRNLTHNVTGRQGSSDPVYSPDGRLILFVSGEFPPDGPPTIGLATMRTDGTRRAFISTHPADEHQPDWASVGIRAATPTGSPTAPSAEATPPGNHAARRRLVWVRYTPTRDSAALVAGGLDGSRQRQLTHPEPGIRDGEPVRSPDGTRVIFNREFPDGTVRIGIVPVRGGPTRFVETGCQDPCFSDQGPAWTPDGNHLTFVRVMGPFDPVTGDAASALQYSERLDGSHLRLLSVPGDYEDNTVRFSPDGRYLVFTRDQTVDGVLHFAIFRMRSDSTHVRQLTPWDLDADRPAVSPARFGPTARLVSFETHGGGHPTQGDVALLPSSCTTIAACTDATRLVTHNTGTGKTSYAASWSRTGHHLAFAQEDGTGNVDIYTIRPDGRHQRPVTHLPVPEYSPAWSY
jgi:Tol biopolymer transport system component